MAANDYLAKLQQKMRDTDTGGGRAGFWEVPQGDTTIRILPPVGQMEFFFQEVGQHRLPDGKFVYCPSFTTDGELPCPICELVNQLYKSTNPADKDLASQLRKQRKYWMNVIARDKKDKGGDTADGPHILTAGVTIFRAIQTLVTSPDYGDISDPEEGYDVVLHRQGEKLDTQYSLMPRKNASPLHSDRDEAERILEAAMDLSPVELSDDPSEDAELSRDAIVALLPYERLAADTGLKPGANLAALAAAPEEDPFPPRQPAARPEPPAVDADNVEEAFRSRRTRRTRQ